MNSAQPGETGVFQAGDAFEHLGLGAILHLGLEPDDVVERAERIVAAQLDDRVGLVLGAVCVGEADRLHRAVAQGLATPFGHHLDRQAAIEIAGRLALVKLGLFGGHERVDKGLVVGLGHRTVEVGLLLLFGFALVIARLRPDRVHVDAVGIDDGRDGVEKGQRFGARLCRDGLSQTLRRQRSGGDDPMTAVGQGGDLAVLDPNIRMRAQSGGHGGGKRIAIHSQGTTGGQGVGVGHVHDQPVGVAHFPMQQPDGVLFTIVRAEGIGADHFRQIAGLVSKSGDLGAHFVNDDAHAGLCRLPGRFGPGHAAADDMEC